MNYTETAKIKFEELIGKKDVVVLAIESSCDETAAAVVRNGREILSDVIASQIEIHRRFGGVVPEIASRNHTAAIDETVKEAVLQSGLTWDEIDAVAVTYGAGLLGALLVGVSYAKALAYAKNKPLIAVSHIKGHISANYLADKTLTPPYICLLCSGGHTAVLKVTDYEEFEVLGCTQDDAVGEAFDKAARVLGLPYPGGPEIQKLAEKGTASVAFPKAYRKEDTLNFSYSGLKTAVINYVHNAKDRGEPINAADVAASFQAAATDMLVENAVKAALKEGLGTIVIAGGVGANSELRRKMTEEGRKHGLNVEYPPLRLCTDNGAMIGSAAYFSIKNGKGLAGLDLDAKATVRLDMASF